MIPEHDIMNFALFYPLKWLSQFKREEKGSNLCKRKSDINFHKRIMLFYFTIFTYEDTLIDFYNSYLKKVLKNTTK